MSTSVSPLQRVLTASAWTGVGSALPQVVFVASTPWLLTRLGVDRFGALALLTSLVVLASALDGGVGAAMPRFLAVARGAGDARGARQLVNTGLVLSAAAALVLGVVVGTLCAAGGHLLHTTASVGASVAGLGGWLGAVIGVQLVGATFTAVLAANERFGAIALAAAAGCAAYLPALVVLVPSHALAGAFAAVGLRTAVTTAVAAAQAVRLVPGHRVGLLPRAQAVELLSYAVRAQVGGLAMLVNAEADTLIVAAFLPLRDAGFFVLAVTVATAVRSVPLWAMPVLLTRMSVSTARQGREGAVALFDRVQPAWASALLAYAVVCLGVITPAVSAWLGPGRPGIAQVATAALVLSAGYLVNLLSAPLATTARATGRPELESRYGVLAMIVNIACTVPLALVAGALGVAAGTAIGCLAGTVYFARLMRQVVPRRWPRLLWPTTVTVRPGLAAAGAVLLIVPAWALLGHQSRWGSAAAVALVVAAAVAAASHLRHGLPVLAGRAPAASGA